MLRRSKRRRAPPAQLDVQWQGTATAKTRMVMDKNRPRVLNGITTQDTTSEMTCTRPPISPSTTVAALETELVYTRAPLVHCTAVATSVVLPNTHMTFPAPSIVASQFSSPAVLPIMTYSMSGTAGTQLNVGLPSVPPAVLTSGLHPYVTEAQPVATCSTPSQPGTYNLQSIVTCQSNALSLQMISTNVLNSSQTCTRASDELGRNVSQSNKDNIMMGQYIDLALLLQNSNLIEASNQQKLSIVQGQLVIQQKQQPKITNIELWTDAFLIFLSIYCSAHVQKIQGLLKYMNTVRLGAKRCGTNHFGCKQYDKQFKLNIADNLNANWADVDVELWLLYINPHNVNESFTSNMIYKCYAFNYNGVCSKQNCTYSHCCIR